MIMVPLVSSCVGRLSPTPRVRTCRRRTIPRSRSPRDRSLTIEATSRARRSNVARRLRMLLVPRGRFERVASGTFGNARRNAPRTRLGDVRHERCSAASGLASRLGATVRWDVFNVFNGANLGLPDANIASTTVSTITTLAGDPRIMQFSVRIDF